jgi:hypothetical protein
MCQQWPSTASKTVLPKKVCAFTSMTSMLKAMCSFIPQLLQDFADCTKLAMMNAEAWVGNELEVSNFCFRNFQSPHPQHPTDIIFVVLHK